eukprot:m.33430 g.33430  ORF g.33430 m.33430 type:complete len:55 (+) comp9466_c0_seq3:166-330(+)
MACACASAFVPCSLCSFHATWSFSYPTIPTYTLPERVCVYPFVSFLFSAVVVCV